ncbi:hypothetical protein CONLIGDRAFT_718772 [Coniochaeta ligniaria NRRL 30616]|uniref:Uncharacterized protein n=1 Tax=Coniochaeta ligniaria NRRL 30616 TaxID=1408157 RepID=A0A1J7I848_9PEZI|nr:hypothetical protein CONLIGDRAFT_718772 [Coniochaeta ligniaria NRRL 30616]
MTSTSKRDSIGDDWEDVGDDNLSIVSLPGSDEGEPVIGVAEPTLQESVHNGDSTTKTTTLHCNNEASSRYKDKGKEIATGSKSDGNHHHHDRRTEDHLPSSKSLEDQSTARPVFEPSASECLNFNPDECQQDGTGELLISADVNPNELLQNIDSVRAILRNTIHSVNDLATLHHETSEKARTICRTLAMQVDELKPIVAGYARAWRSTSGDIPLDPGLYSWLSGVQVKILGLQVELQDEVIRTTGGREQPTSRTLHGIWKDLETLEQQMDEFLPIMQVDFNEFQTQDMSIPTAPVGFENLKIESPTRSAPISIPQPTAHVSGRNAYHPSRPTNPISLLRSELYRLNDEIELAIESLSYLSQHLPHSAGKLAADIAEQYRRVLKTISTMLSNHGSEWIDHGLSGGLTYAEFAQLEADCIHDFATQLNKVRTSLEDMRRRFEPEFLESALHHEAKIGGDSALDQLEVLVQVLSATFCVETR